MGTALATQNGNIDIAIVEKVITGGDLGQLTPQQRVRYYIETCESLGLEWRTRPFDVVSLRGSNAKTLYPNKGCAEQLGRLHHVSTESVKTETLNGVLIETMRACLPNGRCVTKKGAVTVEGLKGDNFANAVMKAETKAFRRAVLALVGLNMADESELDTMPVSGRYTMDVESGEFNTAPPTTRTGVKGVPVVIETVNPQSGEITQWATADAGEIAPTKETADQKKLALGNAIKELRGKLGWGPDDVRAEAERQKVSLNAVAGLVKMVEVLESYVAAVENPDDDEEDYEGIEAAAEQPTLLDAETAVIDRGAD